MNRRPFKARRPLNPARPLLRHRLKVGNAPFVRFLPNMVTIAALCLGLTSLRFSSEGLWTLSIFAILGAALLDTLDGRLARLFNVTSEFGAELDSLSDFLCFGVAPALLVYWMSVHTLKGMGWGAALFFAACTAMRLARFNVLTREDKKAAPKHVFFLGIPAPMGAFLALLPAFLGMSLESSVPAPIFCFFLILSGLLMVSRVHTFSLKGLHLSARLMPLVLMGIVAIMASLFSAPWGTLFFLGLLYGLSIPVSHHFFLKLKKSCENQALAYARGLEVAQREVSKRVDASS